MWIKTDLGIINNVAVMVQRIGSKRPFRTYIRQWRLKRGLTQDQLAARIDSTGTSVSRWENGGRDPTTSVLSAIAYALDVEVADLFRDPDRPSADALLANASESEAKTAVSLVKTYLGRTGTDG